MNENQGTKAGGNGDQVPQPQAEQVFAVVAGVPIDGGKGLRFELRLSPNVSGPVDFLLMLAQLAVANAAKARERERAQPQIQVPQIHLPPNLRSRGKGQGR